MTDNTTANIRELNDQFRRLPESVTVTSGVADLGGAAVSQIIYGKVAKYDDFTLENDPYGEHDFGAFEFEGQRLFWKIDYYNPSMEQGSEDPANPAKTTRVLTIMLASEY